MGLSEDDPVEHGVEASIATSIQAVTDEARRRSLERSYAGVGREFGVRRKAVTWSQDRGQSASRNQVDAAKLGQGEKLASARPLICFSSSSACRTARRRR